MRAAIDHRASSQSSNRNLLLRLVPRPPLFPAPLLLDLCSFLKEEFALECTSKGPSKNLFRPAALLGVGGKRSKRKTVPELGCWLSGYKRSLVDLPEDLIHFQAPTSSSRGSNVLLWSRWSAGTNVHRHPCRQNIYAYKIIK